LSVQGSTSYVTCIKKGTSDSFAGTYTAADGSYVVLDGLGNSDYGKGTAAQYDKDGNITATYTYTINSFGMVTLKTTTSATRIFKPVASSTVGAYVLGDKAYAIVTPDFLYSVSATDGDDEKITYTFDGVGSVVASNGTTYSYTIETQSDDDSLNNVYHLTLKSGSDTFDGVFDYGSSDYTLTIKKK
jgi:hypothetical protein